jgi:hypothetical protein
MGTSPAYNMADIENDLLLKWDGDDYYILRYPPKRYGQANDTTRLVLDFKGNQKEAVDTAWGIVEAAVEDLESYLRDDCRCKYVLALPPHNAGGVNASGESMCKRMANRFAWMEYLPKALKRTESVKKAAYARPGERPTYDDHLRTIAYVGPTLNKKAAALMFDDVITMKNTSSACREILRSSQGIETAKGIYLARTM